jgi:hypothetical protein
MLNKEAKSADERIAFGFALVTCRQPTAGELSVMRDYLDEERSRFRDDRPAAEALLKVGASPRDERFDAADQAAWTSLGRMLLNLDEFVSKG